MPYHLPLAPQIRAIAAEAELRARMEPRPARAATLLRLAEVLRYDAQQAEACDATEPGPEAGEIGNAGTCGRNA